MKDNRKERTRHALLLAMVECLQHDQFDQITASKIAQTAGISRAGFYTHYRDKYELIEFYQRDLFSSLEQVFDRNPHNIRQAFFDILSFLQEEQLLTALLGPNGTREIQSYFIHKIRLFIDQEWSDYFVRQNSNPVVKEYSSVYFAYAFFGILRHWLERGKRESPDELTDFILKLLPDEVQTKN
ncbi:TetR/AcrR family transcriptional regulator [Streptococcus sp. DD13]|uniref:TetR/AcrR family transcriptional regulator n=1 Tax=Streptococcus sp. DD13 TaxID=1777881 RepID=UPI000796C95C|nr:TetR/AcrR family transcriptional regulator C-terminal domain-containing protein [Streptococcus sp. DD13]KXT77960.1 Transcriptional regulator, TetR family [Streptococcus sp. DD13]